MSLQYTRRMLLTFVKANPGKSNKEISEANSIEISSCVMILHSLCLHGAIYREAPTKEADATYFPGSRPMKAGPRG